MLFMNESDIDFAVRRFTRSAKPNRLALAIMVENLKEWSGDVSDGWAYWPAPVNAARQAMLHVQSTTWAANDVQERHDISDADVRKAVAPVKAFLTRWKVGPDDRERILRSVS